MTTKPLPSPPFRKQRARQRLLSDAETVRTPADDEPFGQFLMAIPVAIVASDREGRIVQVNTHAERLLGYDRAELVGQPVECLVPQRYRAGHAAHRSAFMTAPKTCRMASRRQILCALRKDGIELPVEIGLGPLETGQGLLVLSAIHDISERLRAEKTARASMARLHTIIEAEPECVKVIGPGGVLIQMNPAGLAMIEADEFQQVAGKCVYPMIKAEYREAFRALTERVLAGGVGALEFEIVGLKGTPRWLDIHAVPFISAAVGETQLLGISRDITERKQAEEALRATNEQLQMLIQSSPLAIYARDMNGLLTSWNPAAEKMYGWKAAEVLGKPLPSVPDEARAESDGLRMRLLAGESFIKHQARRRRRDGSPIDIDAFIAPLRDASGKPGGIIAVVADITERKQAEDTAQRLGRILDHSTNEIYVFCAESLRFMQVNQGAQKNLGYSLDELRALTPFDIKPDFSLESFEQLLAPLRRGEQEAISFVTNQRRKDGSLYPVEVHLQLLRNEMPPVFVAIIQDITERKHTQEQLLLLAHYDTLTDLPNRVLFNDRLQQALIEAKRHDRLVGMALLDLDDFKKINDTLGHTVGDELLCAVSARLAQAVRAGDTVARLAGDEFAFLLADMARADDGVLVAEKILSAFATPFVVAQREFHMSGSLGLALYPLDETSPEGLLRAADTAMYRAKARGAGNYQFYTPEMTVRARERLAIESDLRHALERNQLTLHYQPLVDALSGATIGAEALLRWTHPTLGSVPPLSFIPVAEATGLIVPIGQWVIETACAQAAAWTRQGLPPLTMAVNVSARQFLENDLVETVRQALETSGLDPRRLHVELTESTLMQFSDEVIASLSALGELGVKIAIDDFGTEYSSFKYLKRFRAHTLKIDRSFVQDVADNANDFAVVKAMYSMADSLGMKVVAEGVETAEQANILRLIGCHILQGYFFGKPQPAEEFAAGIRRPLRL